MVSSPVLPVVQVAKQETPPDYRWCDSNNSIIGYQGRFISAREPVIGSIINFSFSKRDAKIFLLPKACQGDSNAWKTSITVLLGNSKLLSLLAALLATLRSESKNTHLILVYYCQ